MSDRHMEAALDGRLRIAVFGLGYVGTVTSACLAADGHVVTGIDINGAKVEALNRGESPIIEAGIEELTLAGSQSGRLRADTDVAAAVRDADYSIVCVGTPSTSTGDVRLTDVLKVVSEIADALRGTDTWHTVVITSTVPPGTVTGPVKQILEERGGVEIGSDIGLAMCPEFLREATAVADFRDPAKTIIGADDERTAEAAERLYRTYAKQVIRTSINTAEMIKFTDNAWHALKIAFANEIGRICAACDIDSHEVMTAFRADTKLNISPAYLSPGFAFGGSCLPKDLRTLTYRARTLGVSVPVIDGILESNRAQIDVAVDRVEQLGHRRIGLLGIAFKAGTDDLRESPLVELAERLLGKGYTVTVHDEHVRPAKLIGTNLEYIRTALPHIGEMLRDDPGEVIEASDVVVLGHATPRYAEALERIDNDKVVLDLTGGGRQANVADYVGLVW